jgi:hypothetical protein
VLLEVTKTNNKRTHQLVKQSAQAGADAVKAKEWSDEERQAISQRNKRRNSAAKLPPAFKGLPGREVVRQRPPTAPGSGQVEGGVHDILSVVRPRPTGAVDHPPETGGECSASHIH